MHCGYILQKDGTLYHRIVFPKENLYKLIFDIVSQKERPKNSKYTITDKDIEDYLIMCLKHEFGHIIHTEKVIKEKGVEKGLKYLGQRNEKETKKYFKFVDKLDNECEDLEEYYTQCLIKYFEMYAEKSANKEINIDFDTVLKYELKMRLGIYKCH
jgi:hypothetical protein